MAGRRADAFDVLAREGLLVLADRELPSLTTLVAGEPVRGSWWSHPAGKAIYAAASALGEREDAATAKLVDGKVTFVHRALFPALAAAGSESAHRAGTGLTERARELARLVAERGAIRVDELAELGPLRPWREAASELEARLAVHADEAHTEAGRHERVLRSWRAWARERRVPDPLPEAGAARAAFEAVLERWAGSGSRRARLPWEARRR